MDNIVCTVKGNPLDYLEYSNSLHKNLQFTLETPNGNGDLASLDVNIKLNDKGKNLAVIGIKYPLIPA